MTLEEYARQQQGAAAAQSVSAPLPNVPELSENMQTVKQIIKETQINRQITEGCKLQILQSIAAKENPYKIILAAAEAIGRACNQGDSFYLQVQQAIYKAWNYDKASE